METQPRFTDKHENITHQLFFSNIKNFFLQPQSQGSHLEAFHYKIFITSQAGTCLHLGHSLLDNLFFKTHNETEVLGLIVSLGEELSELMCDVSWRLQAVTPVTSS